MIPLNLRTGVLHLVYGYIAPLGLPMDTLLGLTAPRFGTANPAYPKASGGL